MRVETIRLYKDREDVTLTTYVLQDSPEMLNGKKRPCVLICPGGAYLSLSDREAEPVALRFAAMGYHAFVLRYSVDGRGSYPAPMLEIGMAVLCIHEHAEEWLVDTEKIALCGFSAGAHNVSMYATNWQREVFQEYFGKNADKLKPAAVLLGYTLSDYVYMKEAKADMEPMEKQMFAASNKSFLGSEDAQEELLIKASPARFVTESVPPTFLWATAADRLVPVQHTIRMAHALADKKIPFELHIFEEGDHGLSLAIQASAMAETEINETAAQWIPMAENWLRKRFALPLPEKSPWAM